MKKIVLLMLFAFSVIALTSCDLFGPEEKEFSGSGITITLNDSFTETETVIAPLYLTSLNHIFMGTRESKSLFSGSAINSLTDYAEAVLENAGHSSNSVYDSESDTEYVYAYYTASVDDSEFGYMLVCMETDDYYYLMNFGCLNSHLDDNKDLYIEWTDTIEVS